MMKTYARQVTLLAAGLSALVVVGCSKSRSSEVPPVDDERVEIRLNGGIAVSASQDTDPKTTTLPPASRAVIDENHAQDLPVAFARLDQSADGSWPADYSAASALKATRAGGAAAQAITFTTKQYYLTRKENHNTRLVGWYPYAALASGVASFSVDGTTSIMLTQVLDGNKDSGSRFGENGKTFKFEHQLTQLKFTAYAADAAAADGWGKVSSVVLKAQLPTCTLTLPATVAFSGEARDLTLPARKVADDAQISYPLTLPVASADKTNAVECGYALIPPVAADGSLSLVVTTSVGGSYDVPLTLPENGFVKGTAYNIVLKFTASAIDPSATIGAWAAGENVDVIL